MKSDHILVHGAEPDPLPLPSRYTAKDVLETPPTIDDIAAALKNKTIYASDTILDALRVLVRIPNVELFTFGPLALDTVREAQHEAIDFVEYGYFRAPYPVCLYTSKIKYDNCAVGSMVIVVNKTGELNAGPFEGNACIRVIRTTNKMFAMHCIATNYTQLQKEGRAIQLEIRQHEIDYWKPMLSSMEEVQWQMTEGALIMLGLTMIVNTKGVLKERLPSPDKPNKARAKQGRSPLPYTTRVYTTVYNSAVAKGEPGTHASPRPHRRRAHIRHYPKTEKHEAYIRPVDAMLVNWDGRPLEARKEYVVK